MNSLDEGVRTATIKIDISKTFNLVPKDRLLTKIAAARVDLRVWVKKFLVGRSQRFKVDGQLSDGVSVASELPQGSL